MKIYRHLRMLVLFVLTLAASSLTAQEKMVPVEGVQSTNCGCEHPINIENNSIVCVDVVLDQSGQKGIIYNSDTLNIPFLAYSRLTGRVLPLYYDAPEPINIKSYTRSKDGNTFYMVPNILGVDYFYKAVVGTDGVFVKKIQALSGVESIVEIGDKVICSYSTTADWTLVRKLSTFQGDTLIKTVDLYSKYYIADGSIYVYQGKPVGLLGKEGSALYSGIGSIDPETGLITELHNQKTANNVGGGVLGMKDGELYLQTYSAYFGNKNVLLKHENNDWTLLGYGLNLPIQDITTGQWTVYMRVGNVWNGKTAEKEGHYLILGDTDIVPVPADDYRLNHAYIPQSYIEKIWQTYGFMPNVNKIIEINGVEYGIGAGIISTWRLNTSIGVKPATVELLVYPNPATSTINISNFDFNGQDMNYMIIDMSGRTIVVDTTNGTIDIQALKPGVYTIFLSNSSGSTYKGRFQKI